MRIPAVAIIGPGKVGTALGVLAARAGIEVVAVGGGRRCSAQTAARLIGPAVRAVSSAEAAAAAPLILLTVPDDCIAHVCAQLTEQKAFAPGAFVAHCSGALASDVLAPARDTCCCETASMHPLQTFPSVEAAVARLPGTPFFIEGCPSACEMFDAFARAIGGRPCRIRSDTKALYHAAAAMTSNFLVTLLDAASAVMAMALPESAGANRHEALAAMEPLLRATVDNVTAMGPEAALTGPIARGDVQTVQRHLQALERFSSEFRDAYRSMARLTVDLALRKGTLSEDAARELQALLRAR